MAYSKKEVAELGFWLREAEKKIREGSEAKRKLLERLVALRCCFKQGDALQETSKRSAHTTWHVVAVGSLPYADAAGPSPEFSLLLDRNSSTHAMKGSSFSAEGTNQQLRRRFRKVES